MSEDTPCFRCLGVRDGGLIVVNYNYQGTVWFAIYTRITLL